MKIAVRELEKMELDGRPCVSDEFLRSFAPDFLSNIEIGKPCFTGFHGVYPDGYAFGLDPSVIMDIPDDFRFSYWADWIYLYTSSGPVGFVIIPGYYYVEVALGEQANTDNSQGIVFSDASQEEIESMVSEGYRRLVGAVRARAVSNVQESLGQLMTRRTARCDGDFHNEAVYEAFRIGYESSKNGDEMVSMQAFGIKHSWQESLSREAAGVSKVTLRRARGRLRT